MQPKIKLLLLVMLLPTVSAFSQTIATGAMETPYAHGAQVIYGEFGGNGPLFSVNYDFRFAKSQKGFGMHVGLGYFSFFNGHVFSIPVGINHLAGKAPNYFESGIGITYAAVAGSGTFLDGLSGSVLVPGIGYRYQPENSGFFGKIILSPLIGLEKNADAQLWGGIGIGYKF